MRYKYAIYFTWNDGFEDSFNVYDAKERDMNIKEMMSDSQRGSDGFGSSDVKH